MSETSELFNERLKKLDSIQGLGVEPFGGKFVKTRTIDALIQGFQEHQRVCTAGRLSAMRSMGKTTFCDLKDDTGGVQLFVKQDHLGLKAFQLFQLLDIGDIVGVE